LHIPDGFFSEYDPQVPVCFKIHGHLLLILFIPHFKKNKKNAILFDHTTKTAARSEVHVDLKGFPSFLFQSGRVHWNKMRRTF
jgi:hypothetical protein